MLWLRTLANAKGLAGPENAATLFVWVVSQYIKEHRAEIDALLAAEKETTGVDARTDTVKLYVDNVIRPTNPGDSPAVAA
jgi:hypothetical protein